MTNFQKAFCVFLSLCFLMVLAFLPEPFFWRTNIYRTLPICLFLEKQTQAPGEQEDEDTYVLIAEKNGEYLRQQAEAENRTEQENLAEEENQEHLRGEKEDSDSSAEEVSAAALPHPVIDLSAEALSDFDYLLQEFYIVDSATATNADQINAERFLSRDFAVDKSEDGPQILIYHSHSQEGFSDSREGEAEDTVVGVGNTLSRILEDTYGYQVLHVTEAFDLMGGEMDRSKAYDYAREYLEPVLEENPSIQVVIDLHRDGVEEGRRLVTEINGKTTARIMFYNGLSYTRSQGNVDYLPNPYIEDNLAFSFQLEYEAAKYYPDLYRGIYLAGLRYNLHLCPCSLLLEAGAQTNTVEEVKNAMTPFADILNKVISGE
ncbi:MAG: stage II sporulation protein P [Blautia sp.]|nr:stage II sporulation protein P [Blautia sp.]